MLRSAALIPFLLAASASFASDVRFGAAALLTESRRSLDAPLDRIPLFVRDGAILPKTPEDVMTLAPQSDFKDQGVRALDESPRLRNLSRSRGPRAHRFRGPRSGL